MWKKILAVFIGAVIGYWFIDDFDPESLRGKRVLVTGASGGIGEQLAYHYASFGAHVIVTSRREQALQQESVRQLGGLDILVLNHIRAHALSPWTGSHDNLTLLQNILDVNLRSYIHLSSHAMPHLQQRHGSVIVMSSLAGKVGIPYVAAYSSSKFALNGFFSALRNEFTTAGTTVSITICTIGLVGTENALRYLKDFGSSAALLSILKPAEPADAALAVVKGGAVRAREIVYPYMSVKPLCLLRDWMPELTNWIVRLTTTPPSLR
ncbi:hypothetical protein BaRGS_00018838 [Batillaria attramentaria]|uniref:Hydroxysteroid 11-beta-dehydrogenase 1-like protein n=1 Tax=Batillaria attramentaria TaxID=370345 RepID=A0ABD0KSL6_9CAEN